MNVPAGTQFHSFGDDVSQMNDGGFQRIPLGAAWIVVVSDDFLKAEREVNSATKPLLPHHDRILELHVRFSTRFRLFPFGA